MKLTETASMDATAQANLVATGGVSAVELVEAAIERIERLNTQLTCVILPRFDKARAEAAEYLKPGAGIFRGVPFLIKDLSEMVAGEPISWGWKPFKDANVIARSTSNVALKFRDAGLISLGKTTTPEWGPSIATETRAWGATRNPWNLEHGVGGSSGGAAAAVASGMVLIAHGDDAGGSIRIPASCCGLVGLKPSRGRTSIGPLHADIWHGLGEEGALVRSVRDAATTLDVVSGYMPGDPYSAPSSARPFRQELGGSPGQLRVGYMDRAPTFHAGIDPECAVAVRDCAKLLDSLGHKVEQQHPAALDDDRIGDPVGKLVASSEALTSVEAEVILGRSVTADDFDPWTWFLIEQGRRLSAVDFLRAREWINEFSRSTAAWWAGGFDILVTATLATPAPPVGIFKLGANEHPTEVGRRMAHISPFTIPWNVAGNPAISLPLRATKGGLPVGVQLVAAYGREDLLLRLAAQIEQAAPWEGKRPRIHA